MPIDFSKFTDEELQAYHDSLVAKQIPPNPSNKIPQAKPPVPARLQGYEDIRDVPGNIPMSALNSGKRLLMGPQMGEAERDSQGHLDLNAGLHPLIESVKQRSLTPLWDAAVHDPIEVFQNTVGAFRGGGDIAENTRAVPMVKEAVKGGVRGGFEPMDRTGFGRILPVPVPKSIVGGTEGAILGGHYGFPKLGAALGFTAPIIKGAYEGLRKGAKPPIKTSPFALPPEAPSPSSGGLPMTPKDTGIQGTVIDQGWKQAPEVENPAFNKIREVQMPTSGGTRMEPTPTGIEGGAAPANPYSTLPPKPPIIKPVTRKAGMMNKIRSKLAGLPEDTEGSLKLPSDNESQISNPPEAPPASAAPTVPLGSAQTRPVQSPAAPGTQGPEMPTNEPSAFASSRKVIYDENNEPVAYDDPDNPYTGPGTIREVTSERRRASDQSEGMIPGTEAPDVNQPAQEIRPIKRQSPMDQPYNKMQETRAGDEGVDPDEVFKRIANEGVDKRVQDAKAKYEDVYQNVIKGHYTPEQLRNLSEDERFLLDTKIKNILHPETKKKRYSSGLNPAVLEHLVLRLKAETPE